MSKFIKALLFFINCVISVNANIKFEVNKKAALFAQVYFEKAISKELYDELKNSLTTNSENQEDEKIEFLDCLINGKVESRLITGKFSNIWNSSLLNYDRIFDSNSDILNNKKIELDTYYKQILSNKLSDFEEIFNFYRTNLSKNTIFTIYLYPTEQTGVYTEKIGNNIFLRFNYGKKTNDICAICRKICNRLFETMSSGNKVSMEKYFMGHYSKYAKAAYFLLNEVLAYTIGEIWTHSKLLGNSDSLRQKHSNENINKISSALFPLIQNYLKSGTPLDNNFYNSYIKIVELQYPKSNSEYDIMLTNISLIVENGIDLASCINELKSNFEIKRLSFKSSAFSTVFIGNNLGDPALSEIQSKIPNKKSDFLLVTNDSKGKLFVIIKSNDDEHIKNAIKEIKKQQQIQLGYTKDL